jgi:hypothetical protein
LVDILGRLRRPSKRTSVVVVIVLVIIVSSFAIGSTRLGGISAQYSITEGMASESSYERVTHAADTASSIAATADSAKAASDLSELSLWSSSTGIEGSQAAAVEAFTERMVVFTAKIELEVGDVDSTLEDLQALAVDYEGFISAVNTRSGTGAITIRVPQARFYDAVSDVEEFGEVLNRDIKGEDVTENYVDLQARLSNLENQEERLNEVLTLGHTVDDVLKVEKELERVRGEIERLIGEIQYLDSRVELATITVLLNVSTELKANWLPKVDLRTPVSTGLSAFYTIIQGLLSITIAVGPFILIGVPAYYIYKRYIPTRTLKTEETH